MIVPYDTIIIEVYDVMNKRPPYSINGQVLELIIDIANLLGKLEGMRLLQPKVELRKENQIQTICHSLAIEGNTLSIEQVTDLLEDKPVIGPKKEIIEIKNAIKVYKQLQQWRYDSVSDFKKVHNLMMRGLVESAGKWRSKNVGVFSGDSVRHMAPPFGLVAKLMQDLFKFLKNKNEKNLLIKACVFHYELEFIHPFDDGNGRMGRLWQQLILMQCNPVFSFVPVENIIKQQQAKYYEVLQECDHKGDVTLFIEFMLQAIKQALLEYCEVVVAEPLTLERRLSIASDKLTNQWFARKQYQSLFKTISISTATASRDLKFAVAHNLLTLKGKAAKTVYHFNS